MIQPPDNHLRTGSVPESVLKNTTLSLMSPILIRLYCTKYDTPIKRDLSIRLTKRPGVESDGIGGVGGGEDGKKGDYSPFWGTEGDFVS